MVNSQTHSTTSKKRAFLDEAFRTCLARCTVDAAVDRQLRVEDHVLFLAGSPLDLSQHSEIVVISIGKAGATLFDALASRLPAQTPLRAVISAPRPPEHRGDHIAFFAGGHPQTNEASLAAASAALELLRTSAPDALVFFLISGGASAMFELPVSPEITLADIAALNQQLLASGAPITAINCVRKHLSAVKGGRLAMAVGQRTHRTLLISDVPHGALDALGSGPTLPDTSTLGDFEATLDRFHLRDNLPASIRRCIEAGLQETPKSLPHEHADPIVLLDNEVFLQRMAEHMRELGYTLVIDNTCDDWDYQDAARYLLEKASALRHEGKPGKPVCLLSGGEVTVELPKDPGTGGRNQQFALFCALQPEIQNITILSAGTDGMDGNSPAAGAIADSTTGARGAERGLDAADFLRAFNAGTFFAEAGGAIVTGPSGNNLRDIRVLLVE